MNAREVFEGSSGEVTRAYYAALGKRGPAGDLAVNLFRAQKCSTRAKKYRGGIRGVGSFRSMAYETKSWAMENLCKVLAQHGAALRIPFGWKKDSTVVFGERPSWVLYIDIAQGQVSFHSPSRLSEQDYGGEWDGQRRSEERILAFCDEVYWRGVDGALQLAFNWKLPAEVPCEESALPPTPALRPSRVRSSRGKRSAPRLMLFGDGLDPTR